MTLFARRNLIASAAAVAVAGGAVIAYESGSASAQAAPTPPPKARPDREAFLNSVAAKLGIPADRLQAAIDAARKEHGFPERGTRGFGHPGIRGGFGLPASLEVAAKSLGMTAEDLRKALPGTSLAALAKARGVDPAKVKADLVAESKARVDAAVKAGKMTADQATRFSAQIDAMVDRAMAQTVPVPRVGQPGNAGPGGKGGAPGPRGWFPWGRRGPGAPAPSPTPAKSGIDGGPASNA